MKITFNIRKLEVVLSVFWIILTSIVMIEFTGDLKLLPLSSYAFIFKVLTIPIILATYAMGIYFLIEGFQVIFNDRYSRLLNLMKGIMIFCSKVTIWGFNFLLSFVGTYYLNLKMLELIINNYEAYSKNDAIISYLFITSILVSLVSLWIIVMYIAERLIRALPNFKFQIKNKRFTCPLGDYIRKIVFKSNWSSLRKIIRFSIYIIAGFIYIRKNLWLSQDLQVGDIRFITEPLEFIIGIKLDNNVSLSTYNNVINEAFLTFIIFDTALDIAINSFNRIFIKIKVQSTRYLKKCNIIYTHNH